MNPIIKPLTKKEIKMPEWYGETPKKIGYWNDRMRLIFFDPKEVYERLGDLVDPFKRIQGSIGSEHLFPKRDDGICRCGCERKAKRQWHSNACSNFAYSVRHIICYGTAGAKKIMHDYYGYDCQHCHENGWEDIDHVVPVKHGGGGCWLGNFLPLCKECHKIKTNKDFGWKSNNNQPSLF